MRATEDFHDSGNKFPSFSPNRSSPSLAGLKKTLKDTFGLKKLRPGQRAVMESILSGRNTLAIMPAGSGKSLCYQLPALELPGMTVVVSPLIALMKDQAEKLQQVGIDTTQLNSTLNAEEEKEALDDVTHENTDIVFVTPERLATTEFLRTLQQSQIDLFVIDEAHCISKWGHDFRPSYLMLQSAIEALGHPPVLALTATATEAVMQDIAQQLGLDDMQVINTGVYRPNLRYSVVHATSEDEKIQLATEITQKSEGHGIIYAATIKTAERIHQALLDSGENPAIYHGQMSSKQRALNQDRFMEGDARIMVATNAFGMGIDKPDIRFVMHFQFPASLEAYYQESGRAGRDGKTADCILLYQVEDKRVQQFFLAKHYPDASAIAAVYSALQTLAGGDAITMSPLHEAMEQDYSLQKLQVIVKLLSDGGVLAQDDALGYRILDMDAKTTAFEKLAETYAHKKESDLEALERMVFYAQTGFCRWRVLLEYFDEARDWEGCGNCDNCRHPPEQSLDLPATESEKSLRRAESHGAEMPAFLEGDEVSVPRYGSGQVLSLENDQVKIIFPDSQVRTFLAQYVKRSKTGNENPR